MLPPAIPLYGKHLSYVRQAFRWRAYVGPLMVVFGSSLPSSTKKTQLAKLSGSIAPDKDWRQLGIYPPLFDLIGYFKFKIGYLKFLYWVSIRKQISNETGPCFS